MAEQVLKPFKTVNRRFKTGDVVTESDIQGAVSFDQWKARGFIGSPQPSAAPVDWAKKPKTDDAVATN